MSYIEGKWDPYNVRDIVSNVKTVFKHQNIGKLNKPTYEFIIANMGFIAHYNLGGFQNTYQDLRNFILTLQTSEYSSSKEYNLRHADWYERDRTFEQWYGKEYTKSVVKAIRGVVMVARQYEDSIKTSFNQKQKVNDLVEAEKLANLYSHTLVPKESIFSLKK